jgi:hypothetical protein
MGEGIDRVCSISLKAEWKVAAELREVRLCVRLWWLLLLLWLGQWGESVKGVGDMVG